jgi:hypothetical protein
VRFFLIVCLGLFISAHSAQAAFMCPTDKYKGCKSFKTPEGNPAKPVPCQDATHCRADPPDADGVCTFTCPAFLQGDKLKKR